MFCLAIEYDGELGLMAFPTYEGVLRHLRLEMIGFFGDDEDPFIPTFTSIEQVWDFIDEHQVPFNFKTLEIET